MKTRNAAALFVLALGGCASAPVFAPPVLPTPLAWDAASASTTAQPMSAAEFWAGFGSADLQSLLQQAALANPDLLIAGQHLLIARDAALVARAKQQPSLSFNAGPVDGAAVAVADAGARHQAAFELGFNASYELDLWGRLRDLTASAEAEADARAFDADAARIGLMSAVAQTYFDLAQADDAASLLQRRLALAEERLALQTQRADAGRIDAAAVQDADDEVDALRLQLDQSGRQRHGDQTQMALLLGRLPEGYALATAPLRQQLQLPPIPAGLPSSLLQRRPDLRAAAARLDAAELRSAATRAEQFPQIRLTAQLGIATDVLHRAASGAVGLFGFGPEVSLPIADGGTRAAGLDASHHEAEIALLEYRKAAIAAFADVETALSQHEAAVAQQHQAADRLRRNLDSAQRIAAQLAAGRKSRLDAITVEERRLDAEQLQLNSTRAQADSLIALFQALGGGWQAQAVIDAAAPSHSSGNHPS